MRSPAGAAASSAAISWLLPQPGGPTTAVSRPDTMSSNAATWDASSGTGPTPAETQPSAAGPAVAPAPASMRRGRDARMQGWRTGSSEEEKGSTSGGTRMTNAAPGGRGGGARWIPAPDAAAAWRFTRGAPVARRTSEAGSRRTGIIRRPQWKASPFLTPTVKSWRMTSASRGACSAACARRSVMNLRWVGPSGHAPSDGSNAGSVMVRSEGWNRTSLGGGARRPSVRCAARKEATSSDIPRPLGPVTRGPCGSGRVEVPPSDRPAVVRPGRAGSKSGPAGDRSPGGRPESTVRASAHRNELKPR